MIWLTLLAAAAVVLAPLALSLRPAASARGRREAAVALHRAQLAELDRDLADGRIAAPEHASATLEVQRRLLAEAALPDTKPLPASRQPVLIALVLIPLAAFGLYITGGSPFLPAAPLADRIAAAEAQARADAALIDQLRLTLERLDPKSEPARNGWLLLGRAEATRGNMAAAAEAWERALDSRFDPVLAVQTAEALTQSEGRVTPRAAALFRQALAAAPADAPWRTMAEKRLAAAPPP